MIGPDGSSIRKVAFERESVVGPVPTGRPRLQRKRQQ